MWACSHTDYNNRRSLEVIINPLGVILTEATVMARNIQVSVQVALLFCLVNTCMGGMNDLQMAFSQLEIKVNVQQEEIKSLHQIIEHLEKRLEQLEVKGEFGEVQIQLAVPTIQTC